MSASSRSVAENAMRRLQTLLEEHGKLSVQDWHLLGYFKAIATAEGQDSKNKFLVYDPDDSHNGDEPFPRRGMKRSLLPPDYWLGACPGQADLPLRRFRPQALGSSAVCAESRPRSETVQSEPGSNGDNAYSDVPHPPRPAGAQTHKCTDCEQMFMASEIMYDQKDRRFSWDRWQGGGLIQRCFKCLQENEILPRFRGTEEEARRAFMKASRAGRVHLATLNNTVRLRNRTRTWQNVVGDIERAHGMTSAQWRKKVGEAARLFAVKVALAFARADENQKRMMQEASSRFSANLKKAADDPDLMPKLTALFIEHAADNLSEIVKGVDDYYLCRRKGCNFVGPNTHWIISGSKGQYRCPDCGERYHPWAKIEGSDTFIPAQKIMIFDKSADADFSFVPAAVIQEFGSPVCNREVQMVLTVWPNTELQNMLNDFKAPPISSSLDHWCSCLCKLILFVHFQEIAAKWLEEWKHKSFSDLEIELYNRSFDIINKKCYFQKKHLSKTVMDQIDSLNCLNPKVKWSYQHLETGYLGFNYDYKEKKPLSTKMISCECGAFPSFWS